MAPITQERENGTLGPAWPYAALFALAWGLRLLYLLQARDHPAFFYPLVDAEVYNNLAKGLAAGVPQTPDLAWQPWFYPLVLSRLYLLFGPSIWAAKLLQITVGACSCVLTMCLGALAFNRRAGLVAGLLAAFYGPFIFYDGELLAESWAVLWMACSGILLLLSWRRLDWLRGLGLGLCGALCLFTRPPLLAAWFAGMALVVARAFWNSPRPKAAPALSLLCLAAGFLLGSGPFTDAIRQATGTRRFLPLSGGINFYIGNCSRPCEAINIRPGYKWEAFVEWPATQGWGEPKARQAFFYREAFREIRATPRVFVFNLLEKTMQFFSAREIPRNLDLYLMREPSSLLRILVWKWHGFGFPFGPVFGLAAVGLLAFRGRPLVLLACLPAYAAGIVAIHVCDRYRLPVIPFFLVFAAAGLCLLADQFAGRAWRKAGLTLLGVALSAALVSAGRPFCAEQIDYRAESLWMIAQAAYDGQDLDRAENFAQAAVQAAPRDAHAINLLGEIRGRRGARQEAESFFLKAVRCDALFAPAWFNLAKIALLQGDLPLARDQYLRGLQYMPGHPLARMDLGELYERMGQPDNAALCYREALSMHPDSASARQRLERLRPWPARRSQAAAPIH